MPTTVDSGYLGHVIFQELWASAVTEEREQHIFGWPSCDKTRWFRRVRIWPLLCWLALSLGWKECTQQSSPATSHRREPPAFGIKTSDAQETKDFSLFLSRAYFQRNGHLWSSLLTTCVQNSRRASASMYLEEMAYLYHRHLLLV